MTGPAADTARAAGLIHRELAEPGPEAVDRPARESGTCPVCAAQSQAIFEFFARWQHELATDRAIQAAFAAAGGFCPGHSWQFQQIAAPVSLSSGYAPLVEATRMELTHVREAGPDRAAPAMPQSWSACAACRVLRDAAPPALDAFLDSLADRDDRARAEERPRLCLPHLRSALARDPSRDLAEWLVRDQERRLGELGEDLRSFGLKRAAGRRALVNGKERNAWRRAIVQLVGERVPSGVTLGEDKLHVAG